MSVELSPAELGFQRPFTQEVIQALHLRNPGLDPVAFKVKTTAPKQYCVRPNSGRIEPGLEVEVQVILQAMKDDPPFETKCRDKFLVQSVAITEDRDTSSLTALWQHVDQHAKRDIQEKKIRVTWLPASSRNIIGTPVHNNSINGTNNYTPSTSTPAFRSPSPEPSSPSSTSRGVAPVGPVSVPASRPENNKHLGDAVSSVFNPASHARSNNNNSNRDQNQTEESSSMTSRMTDAISHAIPMSTDDLRAELAEAKAAIAKLTQQVQDQGLLRQRRTDDGAGAGDAAAGGQKNTGSAREGASSAGGVTTQIASQLQPAEGVPVQIVMGLCLLSFLLAYFLF
ncbi:MAG: phosphatidylinositol-binding protein scs2 [Peltula sp. TS41687]|nr:MAG: phosphatidylinositol-binding protein scs2 [Peltula sp. TS41687]